jgi:hypothetical protein
MPEGYQCNRIHAVANLTDVGTSSKEASAAETSKLRCIRWLNHLRLRRIATGSGSDFIGSCHLLQAR